MTTRALVLVHDPAESRRARIPGALVPAMAARDITHDVASFVDGREPRAGLDRYDLLIVMGSQESAYDDRVPWLAAELALVTSAVQRGVPILGICFGGQLVSRALNGTVTRSAHPEQGFTTIETDDPDLVRPGTWMELHQDCFTPPPTATEIARNASGSQAFVDGKVLGVQFHPEITVDSFDSWAERWAAGSGVPGGADDPLDVDAMRSEVARNEHHSVQACDQLLGTFCARHVGG